MLAILGVLALGAMAVFCLAGYIGASVLDEQRFPTRYLHDVNSTNHPHKEKLCRPRSR